MTIALLGVTGFRNRGVEALTIPVIDYLLRRSTDRQIRIFSWSAEHDESRIKHTKVSFQSTSFRRWSLAQPRLSAANRLRMMLNGNRHERRLHNRYGPLVDSQLVSQLEGSELAIITGGDVYSSEYGRDSLLYYCSLIHSAKAAGLPVVLLGHTVGRFSNLEDLNAWRECAQHLALLTTRDNITYDYLQTIDGLAAETRMCADVAFGLEPAEQAPHPRFPDSSKPCIALSISQGLHRWCALSADEHRKSWLSLLSSFLNAWEVNLLLIPHVQEPYGDDRQLATELHRALGFDARIHVAGGDLRASEYKRLIGDCQLVIAERMHAAIAGLSSRVPTVMISYSLKVEGIASLAYKDLCLGPNSMVVEANSLENTAIVLDRLTAIWQQRERIHSCLDKTIPEIQHLANQNFSHLGRLMDHLSLA